MSRSLIAGIAITLILISGLSAVFYYMYIREKEKPLFDGIPNSAAFVFEVRNLSGDWHALKETEMWTGLRNNEAIRLLSRRIDVLDSVLNTNPILENVISNQRAALSFHHTGSHIGVMITAHFENDESWAEQIIQTSQQLGFQIARRSFERETILDLLDREHKPVCSIACKEQLLICSNDGSLVEDGILKMKYKVKNPVQRLDNLTMLARSGSSINLYINYTETASLLATFLRAEYLHVFDLLKRFANWSLLNINLEKDQITLKGATVTDDSLYQYLDLFSNQSPVVSTLDQFLPASTAYRIQLGFSDYAAFNNELTEYLQQTGNFDRYKKQKDSLEELYNIDLGSEFQNIIGDQVLIGCLSSSSIDQNANTFAMIHTRDISGAKRVLDDYMKKIQQRNNSDTSASGSAATNQLPFGNFLRIYFGSTFDQIISPYYSIQHDLVLFASNPSLLAQLENDIKTGNTLLSIPEFKKFKEQTGDNYNYSIFINTSAAYQLPSNLLTEEYYSFLNRYNADIRRFEYIQLHYAASSDKSFYTQISFKHNAAVEDETRLLWSTKIDTSLAIKPTMVFNNVLSQQCLLVQDLNNNLYYITQTGSIVWRTKLSGRILSEIYSIQQNSSGNSLYLFNTATQTCLIDANGNNSYGYPVRYPVKATGGMLLTTTNDSNYTWYVALANNRVAAYNMEGKPRKGWNQKPLPASPINAPRLLRLGTKQLIYVTDTKGGLNLLDSNGSMISHDIPKTMSGCTFEINSIDTGSAQLITLDSSGMLVKYTLASSIKCIDKKPLMLWKGINLNAQCYLPENRNYFLLNDSNSFALVNDEGVQQFYKSLIRDSLNIPMPYILIPSNGKLMVAYSYAQGNQIFLFDSKGNTYPSFPLPGNSIFNILEFTAQGERNLIVTDNSNNLRLYRLK